MRCPRCDTQNADDALFCVECGARLTEEEAEAEEKAPAHLALDELLEQESAAIAGSVDDDSLLIEQETRLLGEDVRPASQETALLDQETLLMQTPEAEETVLLGQEGPLAGEEDGTGDPGDEADGSGDEPEDTDDDLDDLDDSDEIDDLSDDDLPTAAKAQPVPVTLDATVLQPRPAEEEHFVVRNTRDYDHDAQSVNLAGSAENFETIHQSNERRSELRRDPYARGSKRGNVPGEGNSRSKLRPLLAMLVVALVLGGGAAVLGYGMELWGGKTVPSVTGQSQANAEQIVAAKGLTTLIETVPADDAIGKVASQDPAPGERIPEGDPVTLYIATSRTMPEVVGLDVGEAQALLAEAGATNVRVDVTPSMEQNDLVIGVNPQAGSTFVSRQEIVLTVAGMHVVPDIVGKKEGDALQAIEDAELTAHVTYVNSDQTVRTVVETAPAAGTEVLGWSTVEVHVSSPHPTDTYHLAEYFSHSSQDIDDFLREKEKMSLTAGFIDTHGNAMAIYSSSSAGTITFSSQPYLRSLTVPKEGSSNVLASGAPIAGVRMDVDTAHVPDGFARESLEQLAELCGLTGLDDLCNSTSITLPSGVGRRSANFACASGRMDNLVWTVLITNSGGGKRAVVTCAKEGLYPASDLLPFGGSVSQYMAYQEIYQYGYQSASSSGSSRGSGQSPSPGSGASQQGNSRGNADQGNGNNNG